MTILKIVDAVMGIVVIPYLAASVWVGYVYFHKELEQPFLRGAINAMLLIGKVWK